MAHFWVKDTPVQFSKCNREGKISSAVLFLPLINLKKNVECTVVLEIY